MPAGRASTNPMSAVPRAGLRKTCMSILRAAAMLAIGLAAPMPAMADPVENCRQNADLALKIDSCTGLLMVLDGAISDHAWGLAERADGYCWLGEPEPAVVDIWTWFDEDPASIRRMQAKLQALGFYAGAIDSGFSAALDDAVVAWAEAGCPR